MHLLSELVKDKFVNMYINVLLLFLILQSSIGKNRSKTPASDNRLLARCRVSNEFSSPKTALQATTSFNLKTTVVTGKQVNITWNSSELLRFENSTRVNLKLISFNEKEDHKLRNFPIDKHKDAQLVINDLIPGGSYEAQLRVQLGSPNQTANATTSEDKTTTIEPDDRHTIYEASNFTTKPNTYVLGGPLGSIRLIALFYQTDPAGSSSGFATPAAFSFFGNPHFPPGSSTVTRFQLTRQMRSTRKWSSTKPRILRDRPRQRSTA